MKKKIIYILLTAAIAAATFTAGRGTAKPEEKESLVINLEDVRGWESWETSGEVGIEIQTEAGDYEISKAPYTVRNVKVHKIEEE